MKWKSILLIIVLALIIFMGAFMMAWKYFGAEFKQKEIETIITSAGDRFQTNLKDSKSIISVSLQLEVEKDKELLQALQERNAEMRSKVLDILRDKTPEDMSGTEGKRRLEQEILRCFQSFFGRERVISVFIDDIVVQ